MLCGMDCVKSICFPADLHLYLSLAKLACVHEVACWNLYCIACVRQQTPSVWGQSSCAKLSTMHVQALHHTFWLPMTALTVQSCLIRCRHVLVCLSTALSHFTALFKNLIRPVLLLLHSFAGAGCSSMTCKAAALVACLSVGKYCI